MILSFSTGPNPQRLMTNGLADMVFHGLVSPEVSEVRFTLENANGPRLQQPQRRPASGRVLEDRRFDSVAAVVGAVVVHAPMTIERGDGESGELPSR